MHPLKRYAVPLGIALLIVAFLWWAIGPILGYIPQFWPALAIAIGIVGMLWAFATERIRKAIEGLLQIPFTRGILIAALFVAIAALMAVLLPETSGELTAKPGVLDQGLVAFLRGTASPLTVFWFIIAGLILRAIVPLIIKKVEAQKAVRAGILLFLVALLGSWLVWGAGWDAIAPQVGDGPSVIQTRVERSVPVELKPGKTVRLDSDGPRPLVPPGYSVDFEMKTGRVFLSSGSGEPVELGMGKRHPWRSPMVLSGDGTVALLLYRN